MLRCPSPPRRTATRLGPCAWAAQGRTFDRPCVPRAAARKRCTSFLSAGRSPTSEASVEFSMASMKARLCFW
eukprot:scaffold107362_cov48-Phaeocystis_antarctica.AAC.2